MAMERTTEEHHRSRGAHRSLTAAVSIALVLSLIALLLHSCDSKGTTGASAYDIWIAQGNQGSVEEFLASLRGRDGTNGRDGASGASGSSATGAAGANGATGAQGSVGLTGLTGAQGDSAYRIWLLLGNTGDEQAFIDSLRGATGATGAQGPVGATGATGAQGPIGLQGPVGATGAAGAAGATGATGPPGADGSTGATGATGAQGPPGADGTPGAAGATGATGAPGADGAAGPQGPPGPVTFGDVATFWDQTTQGDTNVNPAFLADTAYAMTFDHADTANNRGISMVAGSQITFTNSGIYNLQFSAQVETSQGGAANTLTIWLRVNGIDIPWTATDFTLQSNSLALVTAWNFFVPVTCTAGVCDHYELVWSSQSRFTGLIATGPRLNPIRPEVPSIILTVNQVQ